MIIYYPEQTVYARGRTFIYRVEFPGYEVREQGGTLGGGEGFLYLSTIYRRNKDTNDVWEKVDHNNVGSSMRRVLGKKLLRNNNRIIKKEKHVRRIWNKRYKIIRYMIIGGVITIVLLAVLKGLWIGL